MGISVQLTDYLCGLGALRILCICSVLDFDTDKETLFANNHQCSPQGSYFWVTIV